MPDVEVLSTQEGNLACGTRHRKLNCARRSIARKSKWLNVDDVCMMGVVYCELNAGDLNRAGLLPEMS